MWSLFDGLTTNVKGIVLGCAACAIFFAGFHIGNNRYLEYKASVESIAKAQEEKNKALEQEHAIINQGIKNEYEAKLAAVRNFYSVGVRNPSSSSMSGISPAPKGTDATSAYAILVEQCAETTVQVNLWQEWATQNGLVK